MLHSYIPLKSVFVASVISRREELSVGTIFIFSSTSLSSVPSLLQTTLGFGVPSNVHSRKNDSPIRGLEELLTLVMTGSTTSERNRICSHVTV